MLYNFASSHILLINIVSAHLLGYSNNPTVYYNCISITLRLDDWHAEDTQRYSIQQ